MRFSFAHQESERFPLNVYHLAMTEKKITTLPFRDPNILKFALPVLLRDHYLGRLHPVRRRPLEGIGRRRTIESGNFRAGKDYMI